METPELPFAIVESATLEKSFGWVFFYNSKRFIETKDFIFQLAGNGPIFINKFTGEVTISGTNMALRTLIDEYEQTIGQNR